MIQIDSEGKRLQCYLNEKRWIICVTELKPRVCLLTTKRHDVAAVFVNKLPGDRFLHNLLHLWSDMADAFKHSFQERERERESIAQEEAQGLGIKWLFLRVKKRKNKLTEWRESALKHQMSHQLSSLVEVKRELHSLGGASRFNRWVCVV